MTRNVYVLEWYGPFANPQEVIAWEARGIGNGKTYLYLFRGKKRGKRRYSYYCGQAYKQSAGKRMTNKGHHIKEVIERPKELRIWVAKFQHITPHKADVNLVEKLITSVVTQAIVADEKAVLNRTNMLRPRTQVYLINEWYYPEGAPTMQYRQGTIPHILPDVLICYPHADSASVYGNKHVHYINELK